MLERAIGALDPEEKRQRRQVDAVAILNRFKTWLDKQSVPPKTLLGKAIVYARNEWPRTGPGTCLGVSLVVPTPDRQAKKRRRHTARTESEPTVDTDRETDRPLAPLSWAERLKRVFAIDIEVCPKCGGKLRVIATITQPEVIQKLLDHVQQPQAPPRQPPIRVNGPITSEIQFDAI